ncbi:helix-turn-helix domain-containing protein [Deinococcus sp. MIMF12]|uniref:Helix-turn-helix domain-containing protein n=1 Tax=Deinococcus rhizophilus TaxID=3049544 RepID=A0ABT7JDA9_9DEIO|nr:helix-turn-helix domain-containing protein [Deinococcus rhizophilus]MDL2343017.1 helix-turn-helix domain-containing protein [Deinococcus rhizophilus]
MSLPIRHVADPHEQAIAREAAQILDTLRPSLQGEQQRVTLPPTLAHLLSEVLGRLAQGEALTILPAGRELTTQEAADLLGVSRPFLIEKVLEAGRLPYRRVGKHRRIRLGDLLDYQQQDLEERQAAADELTREAQDMGLY